MLIRFSFSNYKSFCEKVTLDLSSTKMTEFSDRVVSVNGEKVLHLAAIYGANASGKSNVYSAFEFMSDYVENSFKYGDDPSKYDAVRPQPFLFDDASENKDSVFEVYFTIPGDTSEREYCYGFSLGQTGVAEEWLSSKAKTARAFSTIFYRGDGEIDLSGIPKNARSNIAVALEPQVLISSLGAKLKIDVCKMIRDWFLSNAFADFGNAFSNLFMSRLLPDNFVDDESVQEDVFKFFATFDDSIRGFEITKLPPTEDGKGETFKIDALHQKVDSDEMASIPLQAESAGTLKMFSLYPVLHAVLECGSVLFVDELNARLHPLLVRNIILTFANTEVNKNHAQLIFTTHDTWQLSNKLLRRDEIWFTEKSPAGISTLYSLADFVDEDGVSIRKDENYEKNYLIGKYGAIPALETIRLLKEE